MERNYIEKRDGGFWVANTRISLDSIVAAFRRGASAETIKHSFPLLSLEEVYGALTFYLAHQSEVEEYLRQSEAKAEREAEVRRGEFKRQKPELFTRLQKAKKDSEVLA